MDFNLSSTLKKTWNNLFYKKEKHEIDFGLGVMGSSYAFNPERNFRYLSFDKSIVEAIITRMALDCSGIEIKHVRLDDENRYSETIYSSLNECLTVEANKDQIGSVFIQDVVQRLLNSGSVAIVPVDFSNDVFIDNNFQIFSMRAAEITEWFPDHVRVHIYNDKTGNKEDIILPKKSVGIIENPFYAIMNRQNSTVKRLSRKLNQLDQIDEQSSSGKLDLIVQLPYVVKTEQKRLQAEERRNSIEAQLKDTKYGIAYMDATERITQLNRPVENNLMEQVKYLTELAYSQLGITQEILNGTANAEIMNNYYNRTIEPIMDSIVGELKRKFLSKTARTQKQTIMYFMDPFKLVSPIKIAEMTDIFAKNEVVTSNEVRQAIGMKPAKDPKADELRNKNITPAKGAEESKLVPKKTDHKIQNE